MSCWVNKPTNPTYLIGLEGIGYKEKVLYLEWWWGWEDGSGPSLCPGGSEQMGMGFPGGVQGRVGWGSGQPILMPDLVVGSSAHGWCLELEAL